jgi:hypothetical protein
MLTQYQTIVKGTESAAQAFIWPEEYPKWPDAPRTFRDAYVTILLAASSPVKFFYFARLIDMPREDFREWFSIWSAERYMAARFTRQDLSRLHHGFYIERRDRKKSRRQQRLSKGARERRNIKAWHKATGE